MAGKCGAASRHLWTSGIKSDQFAANSAGRRPIVGFSGIGGALAEPVDMPKPHQCDNLSDSQSDESQTCQGGEDDGKPAEPVGAVEEIAYQRVDRQAESKRCEPAKPGKEKASPTPARLCQ